MARPVELPASGVASRPQSPPPHPPLRDALHHVPFDEIDGDGLEAEQALAGFEDGLEHGRGVRDANG